MTPVELVLGRLADRGCQPRRSGNGWSARCPAHEDRVPSLSVGEGVDGRALFKCHASDGCDLDTILAALDLERTDLFPEKPTAFSSSVPVATYKYVDEHGTVLFEKVRYSPKRFVQRRPDGAGGYEYKLNGVRRVPYRLPEVIAGVAAERWVLIAEGEKAVDRLVREGFVATCGSGGAGKWRAEYAEHFGGAKVAVLVDADDLGRAHGEQVARALTPIASVVKVLELDGLPEKGDVYDWIEAGHSAAELRELVTAAPAWAGRAGSSAGDTSTSAHSSAAPGVFTAVATDDEPDVRSPSGGLPPTITDLSNARRFVADHGARVRFAPELDAWLIWDGRRWAEDRTGEAVRLAKRVVDGLAELVMSCPDAKGQRDLLGAFHRSQHAARIDGMLRLASTEPGVPVLVHELDTNPWLLVVENGVVDLRRGELRDADPADLCTKSASAAYRPDADCPTWRAALETIFADDDELIGFVQRDLGSALSGDVTDQHLRVHHGGGANGKSTILNTVRRLMGDYGVQLAPDVLLVTRHEQHPTGLTDLRGARFASTIEVEQGRRLAEALTKMLTGGETIRARRMRQDFFEFTPTHKLHLAVNHLPTVRGADLGIWRRILVIPYLVTIPKADQDPHLVEKLWAERDGILAWLVDGCLAWQRDGLNPPSSVTQASEHYRRDQDQLAAFIAGCCDTGDNYHADAKALRDAYEQWCRDTGQEELSKTIYGRLLAEHGYPTSRDKRRREGLRLTDTGLDFG